MTLHEIRKEIQSISEMEVRLRKQIPNPSEDDKQLMSLLQKARLRLENRYMDLVNEYAGAG